MRRRITWPTVIPPTEYYFSPARFFFIRLWVECYLMESGGFWVVANSFVHAGQNKVTSLTICVPKNKEDDSVQMTFSDKTVPIRVKLNLGEVAGLAKAVERGLEWRAHHTFNKEGKEMVTKMQYNNSFINAERDGAKIALKLTPDEISSLELTLKSIFQLMINRKCGV